ARPHPVSVYPHKSARRRRSRSAHTPARPARHKMIEAAHKSIEPEPERNPNTHHDPNFNLIARPYRALEHLTFGPALQRTRTHFLPLLADRQNALILGDGDGRFTAALLSH